MPSFLSKVFGRKKESDSPTSSKTPQRSPGAPSLLEGKFEAVSPTVSPSATHFAQFAQQKAERERERDGALTQLFRGKARSPLEPTARAAAAAAPPKSSPAAPHLSLNFSDLRDGRRALAGVFDGGAGGRALLSAEALGERTLDAPEAATLVRACAKYIEERGAFSFVRPRYPALTPAATRRARNARAHAPALALRVARCATQAHLALPALPSDAHLFSRRHRVPIRTRVHTRPT